MPNIKELRAAAVRKDFSFDALAKQAGIKTSTFYRRIQVGEDFTIGEVQSLATVLDLTKDEFLVIFFPSFVA